MSPRAVSLLVVLALSGCRERALAVLATDLGVPAEVDFGVVYVGSSRTRALELSNRGRAAVEFQLTAPAPFTAPPSVNVPGGSTRSIDLSLLAEAEGPVAQMLRLEAEGLSFEVLLKGVASPVPTCVPSNDCVDSRFDPDTGCVETPVAEGASCGANDRCITQGHCQQGACVGEAVRCDDGDLCTADACNPKQGCIHPPVQCVQPAGACELVACEPVIGCAVRPAMDGARCGANDCQTAQVCIAGACVERIAPEGSSCGEASTCRGPGHCVAGACAPGVVHVPSLRWQFTPPTGMEVMNVIIDTHGNTFVLVGTTMLDELDGGAPPPYPLWLYSFDAGGQRRFAVNLSQETPGLERGLALMADPDADADVVYLAARTYNWGTSVPERVAVAQARNASTGELLWEYDLHTGIPLLNSGNGQMTLELTRILLLSPDVLAFALVEGDSLHQAYVVALSTRTGLQEWKVNRSGHMSAGATGDGQIWEGSAACWSSETFTTRITQAGGTAARQLLYVSMAAFDQSRVLVRNNGRRFEWLTPNLSLTAIPTDSRHMPTFSNVLLEGPMITFVSEDQPAQLSLTRYSETGVFQWSTPLGKGTSTQLWALRDGGTATVFAGADGGTELITHAGDGAELERCPYGAVYSVGVSNSLFVTQEGASISVFSVPGREGATSGWTGPVGYGGTGRAR